MALHTKQELQLMQNMPLKAKVNRTKELIQQWVLYYGLDKAVISFSGGKDSTVLLDIARKIYPEIKAVYINTGLEFPEITQFVNTFNNVQTLRPEKSYKEVICEYGYPMISKEVSEGIMAARRYIRNIKEMNLELGDEAPNKWAYDKVVGAGSYQDSRKDYSMEKYKFLLDAPFEISHMCCNTMKKKPAKQKKYCFITAQMACESRLRLEKWIQNGCNGFDLRRPVSNPMSFWTEQDVLTYIRVNELDIASVYKKVLSEDEIDGQMALGDFLGLDLTELEPYDRPVFRCTGCQRTGCMFCGFGLHLEKRPNRLETILQVSNPKILDFMLRGGDFAEDGLFKPDNRGLGFWFVIKWINIHGGFDIYIPNEEYYMSKYNDKNTEQYLIK